MNAPLARCGLLACALALLWLPGCATLRGESAPAAAAAAGDPHAAAPAPGAAANGAAPEGVVPASFDDSLPGESLADMPAAVPLEEDQALPWTERLAPRRIWTQAKTVVGLGPDQRLAQERFDRAEALFERQEFLEAAKLYAGAARRWPDSALQEEALFRRAEALFFADHYAKAQDVYNDLLKKYVNSRFLDTVVVRQFAIARYWEQVGRDQLALVPNAFDRKRPIFDAHGHAIEAYESVWTGDPTGPLADDAVMAIANAYFLQGRYQDSSYWYKRLRSDFPQSEHQPQAHVLGLRSEMLAYQGANYDGEPLREANELIDQMQMQFPQELAAEEARLRSADIAVEEQLARRDFDMAEYYAGNGYYRAARIYWKQVAEDYPNTEAGRTSQERLAETADKPPVPPDRLRWLTDLIPQPPPR